MDEVMDCVVKTQLKIYNTICYRFWKLCFLGSRQPSLQVSIRVLGWQSGSRAGSRVKTTKWIFSRSPVKGANLFSWSI